MEPTSTGTPPFPSGRSTRNTTEVSVTTAVTNTSTITARPVTLSDHTYVEWSSQFDCDEVDEDKAIAAIHDGVLVPGLRALEQRFGPAQSQP